MHCLPKRNDAAFAQHKGAMEANNWAFAAIAPRGASVRRRRRDALPRAVLDRGKHALRYGSELLRGRDFGAAAAIGVARGLLPESRQPFFWFLNVMEPHAPYLPPAHYLPAWGPSRLSSPSVVHRYLEERFVLSYNIGRGRLPRAARRILRELYAGEIAYADAFLGRLLEVLRPVLDDTVLVITSDHGEHLGERHLLGHQLSLAAELLDVPLVVHGSGTALDRSTPVFGLNGLPALIADAAGIADHPWEPARHVAVSHYESGWEQIRRAPTLAEELKMTDEERALLGSKMASATDGTTTLTVSRAGERVEGDPAGAERLRAALAEPAVATRAPEGYTLEEEAEIEARLRELGYL